MSSSSSFALGIVAAMGAPLTMTLGFIVWDNHWTGSAFSLNLFKCNLASIGFVVLSAITGGTTNSTQHGNNDGDPFSFFTHSPRSIGYLCLSSVIGILVGDFCWLEGLRLLGARTVIVMDSLKPFLAAVLGWALLGEQLQWPAAVVGGIACTMVGILLVSWEKTTTTTKKEEEEEVMVVVDTPTKVQSNPDVPRQKPHQEPTTSTNTKSLATGTYPPELSTDVAIAVVMNDTTCTNNNNNNNNNNPNHNISNTGMEIIWQKHSAENDNQSDEEDEEEQQKQCTLTTEGTPTTNTTKSAAAETASIPEKINHTNSTKRAASHCEHYYGYSMAIVNVVLDTYGSVLTKEHGTQLTTWEINLVRFGFAGIVMLVGSILLQLRDYCYRHDATITHKNNPHHDDTTDEEQQPSSSSPPATNNATTTATQTIAIDAWYKLPIHTMSKMAWLRVVGGVLFVTFLTPALSNYALFQIALALALTLGSIGPLYALPLTYLLQKDQPRPTLQTCAGAMLAVAGIVVLAFWGTLE